MNKNNKTMLTILLLFLVLVISSCEEDPKEQCGDGICDPAELQLGTCKTDCIETPPLVEAEPGVVYLGFMLHLEGWTTEDTNQGQFEDHAIAARQIATIFEENNAKITFEAKPEFVSGCTNWNDNVLLELYNRGHGIGVHADVGGRAIELGYTYEEMVSEITQMKNNMESLIGHDVRHVSGTCSDLDWVTAAIEAGYEFTTGNVAYCVVSMPYEDRPEEFKDCENPIKCHDAFPSDLLERLHPWKMDSGLNWINHDPNGQLVILPANNVIKGFGDRTQEEIALMQQQTLPGGKSVFSKDDVDVYIDNLQEAIANAKTDELNMYYVAWSIGDPILNEEVFDYFFTQIQPYINSGQVEWKTLPEIYDLYMGY